MFRQARAVAVVATPGCRVASPAQVEAKRNRAQFVAELLTACTKVSAIVWQVREKFEVSESTAWADIKYVREEILPKWYAWGDQRIMAIEACGRLEHIADKAIQGGQLRVAVAAIRQMCELQGLNSSQQIAGKRDTLRGELDAMRAKLHDRENKDDGDANTLSLGGFNEIRRIYGLPQFTEQVFDAYRQRHVRGSIEVH